MVLKRFAFQKRRKDLAQRGAQKEGRENGWKHQDDGIMESERNGSHVSDWLREIFDWYRWRRIEKIDSNSKIWDINKAHGEWTDNRKRGEGTEGNESNPSSQVKVKGKWLKRNCRRFDKEELRERKEGWKARTGKDVPWWTVNQSEGEGGEKIEKWRNKRTFFWWMWNFLFSSSLRKNLPLFAGFFHFTLSQPTANLPPSQSSIHNGKVSMSLTFFRVHPKHHG